MPSFEAEFIQSKGLPIKYKDLELISVDRIPVGRRFSGFLRIISTNSEWKQGVHFNVDDKMTVTTHYGESGEGKKFITWADDIKNGVLAFKGTTKNSQFIVYNAWEQFDWRGQPFLNAWQHGAAMIVEINGNTRRYRCNDGHPDDNFDDIVFEIIINP